MATLTSAQSKSVWILRWLFHHKRTVPLTANTSERKTAVSFGLTLQQQHFTYQNPCTAVSISVCVCVCGMKTDAQRASNRYAQQWQAKWAKQTAVRSLEWVWRTLFGNGTWRKMFPLHNLNSKMVESKSSCVNHRNPRSKLEDNFLSYGNYIVWSQNLSIRYRWVRPRFLFCSCSMWETCHQTHYYMSGIVSSLCITHSA